MSHVRIIEHSEPPIVAWVAESDAARNAIREQMERILASPLFKNSKRYPSFLRYVVESALQGHSEQLKERILGIEVFGREPNYDSSLDPVVRTTAGEVRKRIAQYYHESTHDTEIRIDLPSGSYVPGFRLPVEKAIAASLSPGRREWPRYLLAAGLGMTVLSVVGLLKPRSSPTALDHFWRPVLNESGSVLMCVGPDGDLRYFLRVLQQAASAGTPANNTVDVSRSIDLQQTVSPYMAFEDAVTLSRLVGFLQIKEKKYRIRNELSTTLADLRDGPVILIGAFNNDWTMRLTHQARFRFQKDPITRIGWIEDQQNPSRRDWQLDLKIPRSQQTDDYAIISRVMDPTTDRWLVIAAGEEAYGTMAAGEFLSDPTFMEAVAKQAPSNWERENIQIVLGTKVINGNSGPPRVLATYYW